MLPASLTLAGAEHTQIDRDLLMCHCFFYPSGLDGTIGVRDDSHILVRRIRTLSSTERVPHHSDRGCPRMYRRI